MPPASLPLQHTCPCQEWPCQCGTKNQESSCMNEALGEGRLGRSISAPSKPTLATRAAQQWANLPQSHPWPGAPPFIGSEASPEDWFQLWPLLSLSEVLLPLICILEVATCLSRAPAVCSCSHSSGRCPFPGTCCLPLVPALWWERVSSEPGCLPQSWAGLVVPAHEIGKLPTAPVASVGPSRRPVSLDLMYLMLSDSIIGYF